MSWALLYDSLSAQMLGYLRGHGSRDPEGLLGDCFLQIARNLGSFEGDERGFRSWAFTVAHNRLTDEIRSYSRRPREERLDWDDANLPHGGVNVEEDVVANLDDSVEELLGGLTRDQREVILLRVLGDLSVAETARILEKTEGAVRVLQHRAIEALRGMAEADV